jgi:hypothetical protein
MENPVELVPLLKPLFDKYEVAMVPASETSLNLFTARANQRKVPSEVIAQLSEFYSVVDGVPCLNSLDIHRCADLIIFEWWDERELWLGQRDFYTLRWSWAKDKYCIGDAGNVSFSPSDEFRSFAEAVRQMVK